MQARAGPGREQFPGLAGAGAGGQHQYLGGGGRPPDPPHRLAAPLAGHAQVEQDEVGPQRAHDPDRLGAGGRVPDDGDPRLGAQQFAECVTDQAVVVRYDDAYRWRCHARAPDDRGLTSQEERTSTRQP
ncbi:hypothetical protein GCM10019016_121840 [Streptomyces prasinosporus]|uniref:Uncharacterized protein n=1 Tax=Streptomyces prasinosporus TaxID=68256 RepID=A0ABP6UBE3_9ACTN